MKKIVFATVSALALAAIAADSTQFGAMQVLSSTKRTLVAIPWCEASTAGGNIAVSNLVLTANLTAGDTLDVLGSTGASLNRWLLTNKGGVLYWDSVTMVTEGDNKGSYTSSTPAANAETIARGSAVVLIRQKYVYAEEDEVPTGKNVGDAIPFYVMGQVASGNPETTITAGTSSAPCYNMIAPPSTVAQSLNGGDNGATWTNTDKINNNDRIIIPTQYLNVSLTYTNDSWCCETTTTTTNYYKAVYNDETGKYELKEAEKGEQGAKMKISASTAWTTYATPIPVGTGFWYVSYGGSPTVTWSDVPETK